MSRQASTAGLHWLHSFDFVQLVAHLHPPSSKHNTASGLLLLTAVQSVVFLGLVLVMGSAMLLRSPRWIKFQRLLINAGANLSL